MRITGRKKEQKVEKCKEEESKENQEEEVIEIEPCQEKTHASNEAYELPLKKLPLTRRT